MLPVDFHNPVRKNEAKGVINVQRDVSGALAAKLYGLRPVEIINGRRPFFIQPRSGMVSLMVFPPANVTAL